MKLSIEQYEKVKEACEAFHVKELYVFGSAVKNDLNPQSDLDFLVAFNYDYPDGAFEQFMGFKQRLEAIFERQVDLLTLKQFRNPVFQEELENTRKLIYAA
jgi:predicted nucleotidyltransferase